MSSFIFAFFQGVDVYRIVQFLTVPLAIGFIMLSSHRVKTLQRRLDTLLDSIEFGWEELNGIDLDQKEADHLHQAFASTTVGRMTTNQPICAPVDG